MKKHYIKVYWSKEWDDLSNMLDEIWDEDEPVEYQSTYAQHLSYEFGGVEDRKQLYLISGRVFFNIGCDLSFDEVIIGNPEDDDTWVHLYDIEFECSSTPYELLTFIGEDPHQNISVFLDKYKKCKGEKGYRLLELGFNYEEDNN